MSAPRSLRVVVLGAGVSGILAAIRLREEGFEDVTIYAIRLDRGMSSQEVLDAAPGSGAGEEIGLNGSQYIVPGGGGLGEVINNAWV